ncbi:methyltransferase domain-containing protein [Thermoleptolyngbya sp. M55_K2018_002]|uniref:methyltransferase domain-containing protein n=1 Tax=Thermoleptolyngbya sp. M55_K2018_002 TaxID=2747808 RepID=UPI001A0DE2C7|nr:methyltransferase domain-containing protein [Thermoleptolyngbya sp. M55_K2018_002]HIK39155.1 methyltransferase domain-containing protein [Thermoleptolyngbya sp. M55_K2018_002]
MLSPEALDKIRQQFDHAPYPRVPLEQSPKDDPNSLFKHSLITAYYRRDGRVIDPQDRLILDAGCGSGYKCLMLAEANPGAKIVGMDLSEKSVELTRQRLAYHGFDQVECYAGLIEELPQLGIQFDYINCDEVLYLLPNPLAGLQAMRSVLKPDGLLRVNLHSAYQRRRYYQAQDLFRMLGLMEGNPEELEVGLVHETMNALQDHVVLKTTTWHPIYDQQPEGVLVDHLLLGDKGYTIPDLFGLLKSADLELISMVNWLHWDLRDLFQNPHALPEPWDQLVPNCSIEDQLYFYELLNPVHRLLDAWCGVATEAEPPDSRPDRTVQNWALSDWQRATLHLHPQLRTERVRQALLAACQASQPFEISRHLSQVSPTPVVLSSSQALSLLPLWDGPHSIAAIAHQYQRFHPVQLPSLEPMTPDAALGQAVELIKRLERCLFVLVEL